MKHLYIVFIFFFSNFLVYGQVENQAVQVENQAVLQQTMKEQATKLSDALVNGDYATLVKLSYPKIVAMLGGPTEAAQKLKQLMEGMKEKGMVVHKVSLSEPSTIVKQGNELQCMLPQSMEIKSATQSIIVSSTLLAFSTDNGVHWTFVDTSNKSIETVRKMLPNFSTALVIPPNPAPKIVK